MPAERRAEILDHAIRSIGTLGFNGMSVGALAQACGISKAGVLHYFGSKDGVLIAVLDEIERRELGVIGSLLPSASQELVRSVSRDQLISLMRLIIERFVEEPVMARFITVLQAEALDPDHPAHDWFGARERSAVEVFGSLLVGFHPDPASSARQLLALMHGLAQQWLRSPATFAFVQEWDKAISALLHIQTMAEGPADAREKDTISAGADLEHSQSPT